MKFVFLLLILLVPLQLVAMDCQCQVQVFPPMTGPIQLAPNPLNTFQDEGFFSYSEKNRLACRQFCQEKFVSSYDTERMNALLLSYSLSLIDQKVLGYNCTGLTTFKYPVRVKAQLGRMSLGNVVDQTYVINHEEECF